MSRPPASSSNSKAQRHARAGETPSWLRKSLIGMVHVGSLPGTPNASEPVGTIIERAVAEATLLAEVGFDAVLIENMHDAPYIDGRQGPEITAAMTAAACAIRAALPKLPLGVQVLSRGHQEALAVALAAGCQFIRCENFVFAHIADEGLMSRAEAGPLLRYRRAIGAGHIAIYTDVQKKHATHAITAGLSIADWVHGAEFFGSDGVIITGTKTGEATDTNDVRAAREATTLPILVGSGVTPETLEETLLYSDAAIVGSSIKFDGHWANGPDRARCKKLIAAKLRLTARD